MTRKAPSPSKGAHDWYWQYNGHKKEDAALPRILDEFLSSIPSKEVPTPTPDVIIVVRVVIDKSRRAVVVWAFK